MAQAALLREDMPLDEEERRRAEAALETLPRELRNGAFGGDERAFADCVARCIRGEPPQRSAAVLHNVLKWRASVRADTPLLVCSSTAPLNLLAHSLPGTDAFHAAWAGSVHGADRAGHCVWFERLRDVDMHALIALSDEQLSTHRAQALEVLALQRRVAADSAGRCSALYTQHIYVMDVGGVSPALLLSGAARRVLGVISNTCSSYYGETLFRVYLVHVHAGARIAYGLLRPLLLQADTAAKVCLCGGHADFRRAAARDGIDVQALPTALGGGHAGVSIASLIEAELQRALQARRLSAAAAAVEPESPSTPPLRDAGRRPRMSVRQAVSACWAGGEA